MRGIVDVSTIRHADPERMSVQVIDSFGVVVRLHSVNTEEVNRLVAKITHQIPDEKDDYTTGVADGMKWAIRVLTGDKSAT